MLVFIADKSSKASAGRQAMPASDDKQAVWVRIIGGLAFAERQMCI